MLSFDASLSGWGSFPHPHEPLLSDMHTTPIPIPGLRQRISDAGPLLSGYCMMPGAFSAEVFSSQGFDCIAIDMQHGLIGFEDTVTLLQAISQFDAFPLVRVPTLEPGIIMRVLDAGALGIICPMIETAEQATQLVTCSHYPPLGNRSYGPLRAALRYGPQYVAQSRDIISLLAMVETAEGVRNVEEIAAVEGLSGIYIGTVDLALSLGVPDAKAFENKILDEAIQTILDAALKHGLIVGLMAQDTQSAVKFAEMGFNFLTVATDVSVLRVNTAATVNRFRGALSGQATEAPVTARVGY
ncbi:HpcH/HpaI aldolase family protein [Paraburkholderia azotifigens]|uniref:Aldolase/citrate lyase family protein n=1 Tax=Paraburkholderia azotifigens TaxID=2057004 RepID=A0ABU9RDS3_9BURK